MSRITPRDASAPKGRFRNLPQAHTPTSCPSATTRDYHKCGGVNAENGILMMAFENLWRNYGRPRVLVVFELSFYFAGVWPPTKKGTQIRLRWTLSAMKYELLGHTCCLHFVYDFISGWQHWLGRFQWCCCQMNAMVGPFPLGWVH